MWRRVGLGLVAALLGASAGNAAEVSPGTIRFSLCRTNVQSTTLFRAGDQWGFVVRLERNAARDLERAVRAEPDKTLEVVMGDTLLHRARVRYPNQLGSFTQMSGDLDQARRDLELFRNNLYEGPCGLVDAKETP